jgi:hypothetical protein
MGAGPDDRFASGQSEDADVEKTADKRPQGSDHKIERPFMHNRLRNRLWLGTLESLLLMPNKRNQEFSLRPISRSLLMVSEFSII